MALTSATAAAFSLVALPILLFFIIRRFRPNPAAANLPPGSLGWPIIGETLTYFRALKAGAPERFINERIERSDSQVFKTGMLGHPTIVFTGTAAHKFLFGNERKLVRVWWPPSVHKLFGPCLATAQSDSVAQSMRKIISPSFNPDVLIRYVNTMDEITIQHLKSLWQGKEEITVYPTIKHYTFELACRFFLNLQDPIQISNISTHFNVLLKGVIDIPLNFPGTRFHKAMKAAEASRDSIRRIVTQRKSDLNSSDHDLLSNLLITPDEQGRYMNEDEIINNILLLLFAGHDTSCSVITVLMKYLAELPQVYDRVFAEQMEIANSKREKGGTELLEWEDIQRMRYSWHVVSEAMRLTPPVAGGFREAVQDFSYKGYTIPKGWKIFWSSTSTQKDPALYPDPEEFDASRFDGAGPAPFSYVPFGGGPRMCLGKEYARLEILVFLHNIVKKYRWELVIPGEKIEYDPMATPANGLRIRLFPHSSK